MTTLFDSNNLQTLRRDRVKSGLIAFLISVVAMLLLYFVTLHRPNPPLSDTTGVVINIGLMAGDGDNSLQPSATGGNPDESSTPQNNNTPTQNSNIMTSDDKTAPHVPTQTTTPAQTLPVITAPTVNHKFTMNTKVGGTNPTGGTSHGPGGPGPGGNGPGGPGTGGQNGWDKTYGITTVGGTRSIIKEPKLPENTCGVYGNVEIKFTVNKNGEVVFSIPTGKGTTSSQCLKDLASNAAKTFRFNKTNDPAIPEMQVGYMTIRFVAK